MIKSMTVMRHTHQTEMHKATCFVVISNNYTTLCCILYTYTIPLKYLFWMFSRTSYSSNMYRPQHTSSHDGAGCVSSQNWMRADCRWERSRYDISISFLFESGMRRKSGSPCPLQSFTLPSRLHRLVAVREGSNGRERDTQQNHINRVMS